MSEPPDAGGDPACWADELCPDCGAVPRAGAATCWHCGHDFRVRKTTPDVEFGTQNADPGSGGAARGDR